MASNTELQEPGKLAAFLKSCRDAGERAFLCVFGRESNIVRLKLKPNLFEERGDAVIAKFGVTRFGCRVFEFKPPNEALQPPSRAHRKVKPKPLIRGSRLSASKKSHG